MDKSYRVRKPVTLKDSASSSTAMSWRLSPSSSGYKSQSQRSDSVTPSPTATPFPAANQQTSIDESQPTSNSASWDDGASPPATQTITKTKNEETITTSQPSQQNNTEYVNNNHNQQMVWSAYNNQPQKRPTMVWHPNMNYNQQHNDANNDVHHNNKGTQENNQPTSIMWAITDLKEVPKGSHIINSETGAPFKNPDGTDYAFDPHNLHPALVLLVQSSEASLAAGNNNCQIPPPHMPPLDSQSSYQQQNAKPNISLTQKANYNSTKPILQRTNSKPLYNNQYSQGPKTYVPSSQHNNKQSPPPPSSAIANKPPVPGKSPPNGTTNVAKPVNNQSPTKKIESTLQSPKKFSKFHPKNSINAKPNGSKTGFSNSATSPGLPYTPPAQAVHYNNTGGYQYMSNSQFDNTANLPIATFPLNYSNNGQVYASNPMVPVHNSSALPVYGDETSSMVYGYGVPQYARMDSVSELNGYFVNMNLNSDVTTPGNSTQPIAYQSTTPYWGHQPMVCYVPPQNNPGQQRYPVPLVQGQSSYLSTYGSPQTPGQTSYAPAVTPGTPQQQANNELLPIYQTGPPPIVYGHPPPAVVASGGQPITNHTSGGPSIVYANQPPPNAIMYTPNVPHQIYAATPNLVYTSTNNNASIYPAATNTPNSNYSNNSSFTPSSVYSGSDNKPTNKYNKNYNSTKNPRSSISSSTVTTHSNQSSASSNSPASTVVQTHYNQYSASGVPFNRHCSPSETPPNTYPAGVSYGYQQFQQNCGPMPPHILPPQAAMIYRNNVQVAIRASPPVNSRTSRSPTPTVDHFDRSNRYSMASQLYQTVPCVVPGDMRFMSPRQQLPPYKNAYNRPPFPQNITDSQFGRPPKIRKPRN